MSLEWINRFIGRGRAGEAAQGSGGLPREQGEAGEVPVPIEEALAAARGLALAPRPLASHFAAAFSAAPLGFLLGRVAALSRDRHEARRGLEDAERARTEERKDVLLEMTEVADVLRRVISAEADEGARRRLHAVADRVRGFLERRGVTAMEADGKPFDPRLYRRRKGLAGTGRAAGEVVETLSEGYFWRPGAAGERQVLRYAEVVVADAARAADGSEGTTAEGGERP